MMAVLIKFFGIGFSRFLFRNKTTSAITAVLIVMAALFVWHKFDKNSAVRAAIVDYVADVELQAARAQIKEANRREAVAVAAGQRLEERMQVAKGEAARAAYDIKQYEAQNEIPVSGRVNGDIFGRLRAN